MKKAPITAVITLLAALIILSVWIVVSFFPSGSKKNYMTDYNAIVETLSKVDSLMIGYSETGRIKIAVDNPVAMHIDAGNRLFVASGKSLYQLDSTGIIVRTIPAESAVESFVTDDAGNFYCAGEDRIFVLDSSGTKKAGWNIGDGRSVLVSIAVDGDHIFVGDAGMKTVWHLNAQGKVIGRIADKDSIRGIDGLIIPSVCLDLATGQGGSLWVVNSGRHRVENYRYNGDLISFWGDAGNGLKEFCGCCNPAHVVVLPDGRFVTSEKGILRVKVYDQAGNFESVVAASFKGETSPEIAVDSDGTIFVLDTYEKTIRQFKKKNS